MAVIGVAMRTRRLCGVPVLLLLAATGLLSTQSAASGASSLSSVVLSRSLPGFVASPLGVRNGPIDQSNITLVTGASSGFGETEFAQLLASGNVSGYVRSWVHQPVNGDAVVITALQFLDPTQAASFVNGEKGSVPPAAGISQFPVPNVPAATGYLVHATASGTPVTEYIVVFGKGSTDIQMAVATESGDVTSADAAALASQQWANVPTPTNWTPIVRSIDFLGTALLSLVIVLLARRRHYPAALSRRATSATGANSGSPLLASQGHQS